MIPAAFDYAAPETLEEAIAALAGNANGARLLAGGHSLLPLMKLRFASPALLVDLRRVIGLHGIQRENGTWRIGAMTTHADLERAPELGVLARVAATIADPQVRNRGTIGGSLAHGDPASDLPAVLLAGEGTVTLQGPAGQRTVQAAELFRGYMQTAVEPTEVLTEVRIPAFQGWGFGHQKFNRRSEDWAMVGVVALVKRGDDGSVEDVRVGLTHMGIVPLRASAVEAALRGRQANAETIAAAAEHAAEGTNPAGDLNASPEYKRHLARVLCRRALSEAVGLA